MKCGVGIKNHVRLNPGRIVPGLLNGFAAATPQGSAWSRWAARERIILHSYVVLLRTLDVSRTDACAFMGQIKVNEF